MHADRADRIHRAIQQAFEGTRAWDEIQRDISLSDEDMLVVFAACHAASAAVNKYNRNLEKAQRRARQWRAERARVRESKGSWIEHCTDGEVN